VKLPPRFETIAPYLPGETLDQLAARLDMPPEEIAKLDANENPYGPAPRAQRALAEMRYAHFYPDPDASRLRAALAGYTGAMAESLMVGSGADELIDLLLRVLLEPGDGVLVCPPTFSMYALSARIYNGRVLEVPRLSDFSLDLPAIHVAAQREQPKILFITNPNNPDGRLASPQELDELLELPLLVVLDEAYIEFAGEDKRLGADLSHIRQVTRRENLAVLRTFSKWAGLAGLRVGYGAFPAWLMPALWKAKPPFNVNVAGQTAALASLEDVDYLAENVARIRAERQRLFAALRRVPFLAPQPSRANFILCKVRGRSAAGLKERLADQGILIRAYDDPYLENSLRISVGRPQDTDRLLAALEKEI
jgi:histidinol-phosphate aminotransferase